MSEKTVNINDKDYNFDELSKEQQILVEHVETCRRNKNQLLFQIDRENVAEGAFAKMLTESAISILVNEDKIPKAYGVLTPASGIGLILIDRLRYRGISFTIDEEMI